MGSLTTKITETFVGNNGKETTTTTLTLASIEFVDKRIMAVPVAEKVIATFAAADSGGTYTIEDLRYLRITNLDDTNYVTLVVRNTESDEFAVKLDAGQSFYLNGDTTTGLQDYCIASTAAVVITTLYDVADITATANTATCSLELYVASVA